MAAFSDILIRPCFTADLEQVQLIYAHHVVTGAGTFEATPPDLDEIVARWSKIVQLGWPWLVAAPKRDLSRVLGFAYATQFRDRAGYAHAFEDSVYVAPAALRQGIGKLLLAELLSNLSDDGVRQVLAFIGDSRNAASIALHKAAGFRQCGVLAGVGFKFDRAFDVVIMQKALRPQA